MVGNSLGHRPRIPLWKEKKRVVADPCHRYGPFTCYLFGENSPVLQPTYCNIIVLQRLKACQNVPKCTNFKVKFENM